MSLNAALYRFATPFVDPAVFDFWASHISSTLSWTRTLAKVVERKAEAKDCVTLVLKANRHFKGFKPGQHVNVTLDVEGVRHTRSYSLTSVPGSDRRLSITVKRIEGGKVSTELCQNVNVGSVLELSPAFGDFALPANDRAPILLVGAGSGITPLMGLLRTLTQSRLSRPVTLLYWARNRAELCFLQELKTLEMREPLFNLKFILTREPHLLQDESAGRPSQALLKQLVNELSEQHAFLCGPGGFVEATRALLENQVASLQSEAFTLPVQSVSAEGSVQVHLKQTGRTLTLPAGQSLLEALEAEGVRPASGCRMGICNSCACDKLSGTTENMITGARDGEPTAALKICVNQPRSDLTLNL